MPTYRLPTIPYDIIAAVNRAAAATGTTSYASKTHRANYNGHHVTIAFNDYRQYWVTEYFWAGRVVLARGSFEDCLEAGIREYQRGALGTTVSVGVDEDQLDYAQLALLNGFLPSDEADAKDAEWKDERFDEVHHALTSEKQTGVPATAYLIQAKTLEEYRDRRDGPGGLEPLGQAILAAEGLE